MENTPLDLKDIRRVVQLSMISSGTLVALCDDGTMWLRAGLHGEWVAIPNVPQPSIEERDNYK